MPEGPTRRSYSSNATMAPRNRAEATSSREEGEDLLSSMSPGSQPPQQTAATYGTMFNFRRMPSRASVYRRKSFIEEFVFSNGPPQIIALIVLFAFGFGSVIGVVPAIMSDRYARINHGYHDAKFCNDYDPTDKPQACLDGSGDAQGAVAVEQFISNGLTFLTSSLVGSLSDEYGRKGILLCGVFLASLSPFFLLLVQLNPTMSPIWYYTVGALQGLINWMAVALSALSDVMPKQWRAPSFGLVLAGFSLGFALAPQMALFLGPFHVTIFSLTVVMFALVVILVFFPETLSEEASQGAQLVRIDELADLEGNERMLWFIMRPFRELSILNRNRIFRTLTVLAFASGISSSGSQALFLYYIEERLGFDLNDVALLFAIIGFSGIFVQGLVLKIVNDLIGERRLLIFSFVVGMIHAILYCVATTKFLIFVSAGFASLVMMAFPTISAIKANNVNQAEQGRIQGALYSVQALASAVGPSIFRLVYSFTKDGSLFGPGSMFMVAALCYFGAAVCSSLLPDEANSRRGDPPPSSETSDSEVADEATPDVPLI
mmetsp:Transcript_4154/g.8607  ORF Transcript_4154/g.8607 Transcript_4154/m.8607 type:complete len:547 (+) Transcript_4154:81-1721(+)